MKKAELGVGKARAHVPGREGTAAGPFNAAATIQDCQALEAQKLALQILKCWQQIQVTFPNIVYYNPPPKTVTWVLTYVSPVCDA